MWLNRWLNKIAEKEEFGVLQTSFFLLRLNHWWPVKKKALTFPLVPMLIGVPLAILNVAHFVNVLINDLPVSVSADINALTEYLGCYYIVFSHVIQRRRMTQLCLKLSDFETFGKPPDFDRTNARLNLFSFLFRLYILAAASASLISPFLEMSKCERRNEEQGLNEFCGIFVPLYLPFTYRRKYVAPLALFVIASMIHVIGSSSCVTMTAFEISQHIVLRIKHLNQLLREMFDAKDKEEHRTRLDNCIRYHQFINGLVDDFNASYAYAMSCYLLMTGLIFGCIVNVVIDESSIGAASHMPGWICALYIVCYAGQALTSNSEAIPVEAFGSKWYETDLNNQKKLVLFTLGAQKPFYLHCRPVGIMSLSIFLQVLKASYSYVTLLNKNM